MPGVTPRRRLPNWLKVTLGVFAVLFVLGAIVGKAPENSPGSAAPAVTSAAPPVPTYTVTNVIDGEQIYLRDSTGVPKTVRAAGIDAPAASYCHGPETAEWATGFLAGKQVTIRELNQATGTVVALTLSDGTDYSTAALEGGNAKYLANLSDSTYAAALQAAETTARTAGTGLWGPPCIGTIDGPTPVPTTTPQAPPPTTDAPAPTTTTVNRTTPPPPAPTSEQHDDAVSYKNCDAVRAAGKAPLLRGQPGYSSKLDRDGDGVACEPKG